jgi:zinc/manganese transport system substrate-binding protein
VLSRCVASLVLFSVAACGGTTRQPALREGVVHVVAIENTWGDITAQIGGAHVVVTSVLTDPSTDPHTFETDPKTADAVSNAGFVVTNGLGYDAFADKLLSAGSGRGRTVLTVADVLGLHGDGVNPHLWYSPTYVQKAASAIAGELSRLDPTDAAAYAAGLKAFLASYQSYVEVVAQLKAHAGEKVAYTEPVPGYLVGAAGLVLGTPASFSRAVEDGNDPSPADFDAFRTALRTGTVKVLLYNSQVTSPLTDQVKQLAAQAHTPLVEMTETLPAGETFAAWQTSQASALLAALR